MSLSSTTSSARAMSNQDIRYVEEGIDYNKTPKPLLYLKLSTLLLFTSLIILASVQFGLNKYYENQNLKYQNVLLKSLQNQELISQLTLMTRTFLNINLNLEPQNTEHFEDRRELLKDKAEAFIEQIRINVQYLHNFFRLSDTHNDEMSDRQVTMHSVYSNNVLWSKIYSRLSAINIWLVNVYQIFALKNFTSSIGVYAQVNSTQQSSITALDQSAFFVLLNAHQSPLYTSFTALTDVSQSLISKQVSYSIEMNKYYVSITAVLVLTLTAGSVYLISVVLRFKSRVLAFFAEIDVSVIAFNEQCSREFYEYLVTDEKRILEECRKNIEEYNRVKASNLEQQESQMQFMRKNLDISSNTEGALDNTNLGESVDYALEVKSKENKEEKKKVKGKHAESLDLSDSKEDSEGKRKAFRLSEKQKMREQIKKQSKKTKQERHQVRRPSIKLFDLQNGEQLIKNKQIAVRLNEQTAKKITSMIILGIVGAIVFIAYFIAQYFLCSNNELEIESNSSKMVSLFESVQCTNVFHMDVRNLQTSNSSWYDLSPSQQNQRLRFVPMPTSTLNQTYQSCINQNQQVNQWLSLYNHGSYLLSNSSQSICSLLNDESMRISETSESSQNIENTEELQKASYLANFNITSCQSIYQGILSKSILQITSVFMQDALYRAIRYMAVENRGEEWINGQIAEKGAVEMIDAHTQYVQTALRRYYEKVIEAVFATQDNSASTILFIVFMIIMTLCYLIIIVFVVSRIRQSFWHSFFILRLIPTDDVDKDFIKRINDYLSQA
ncbi:hypothetical protein FGO68_gene3849 [Halteria grandinella]|uniref:Uncharacterized protein n=1 Tax=Halteria grandinella TaxID=5974 RepID=A0A8J8P8P0_HALGN|nr:hypothetical protein FGO68_gene3849 [Halteria grandinella]